MDKTYKVTQEVMNELIGWRDNKGIDATSDKVCAYLDGQDLDDLPFVVDEWWRDIVSPIERNKRLIAIISWLNGDDVFEFEEPNKFVVRSRETDGDGDYWYVFVESGMLFTSCFFDSATKFDTREKAQEWANSHQVIVEVDADGNEV